jgi:hypothetical protein
MSEEGNTLHHFSNPQLKVLRDESDKVRTICDLLRSGRGSNLPGIGLPTAPKPTAKSASEGH